MNEATPAKVIEINRKMKRQQTARDKAHQRKLVARQRAEQDRTWARLRRHVEGAVIYEIEQRGAESFDKETRRVQGLVQEFVRVNDLALSMTVASLANYLSRMTFVMERLRTGELQQCPACIGKVMQEGEVCQVCKGTSLVEPAQATAYLNELENQIPAVAEVPDNAQ